MANCATALKNVKGFSKSFSKILKFPLCRSDLAAFLNFATLGDSPGGGKGLRGLRQLNQKETKMNQRQQLTSEDLLNASVAVEKKLFFRADQKGLGTMASNHEILGIVSQEVQEYNDAIHGRLSKEEKIEELKDIAVAAIFGIASIESGGVDW